MLIPPFTIIGRKQLKLKSGELLPLIWMKNYVESAVVCKSLSSCSCHSRLSIIISCHVLHPINLNECLTSFDFWLVGANHTFNSNFFFCILAVYIMCMSDNMIHRIPYDFDKQLIMKTTHKIRQVYHTFLCVVCHGFDNYVFICAHRNMLLYFLSHTKHSWSLYAHLESWYSTGHPENIHSALIFPHFVMPHPYSKRD